jgi:hypothetical protein
VLVLVAVASASCSEKQSSPPPLLKASVLEKSLLKTDDLNNVMGTTGLLANQQFTDPRDHRILLPNLNCLGIWEVAEKAIYDGSSFTAMRGQLFRQPDNETWEFYVEEATVLFPDAQAANAFLSLSADRWSKCTNHRVNITLNDQPKVTYWFGDFTKADTRLAMPVTRGAGERKCQHVLSVDRNLVIDVLACSTSVTDQAATIVQKIKDRASN